jgi:hypothetical protein
MAIPNAKACTSPARGLTSRPWQFRLLPSIGEGIGGALAARTDGWKARKSR